MTRMSLLSRPCPSLWLLLVMVLGSVSLPGAATEFGSSASAIDDDVLYHIGGGSAVNMGRAGSMQSLGVGVGWNTNLLCGKMDLNTTLHNQLNGLTDGFQNIMGDLIQSATGAVASLPALIIQRADPGLYNLLTNGILQARLDFDRSKTSCREMAERMMNVAGSPSSWSTLAEGQALKEAMAQSQDAVAATAQAESDNGNAGVPWVGGEKAGGKQQAPIKVVKDVTKAGYNLLNGRKATQDNGIDPKDCNGGLLCKTWKTPDEAAGFANRVLGEDEQQTCEGCTKSTATAGVGLTPLIQEEYEAKLKALGALINGSQATTPENLDAAGSNSMPITRGVITALRDEPDQKLLSQRLASEIAVTSILEKALLLQRALLAGKKEPNVSASGLAAKTIDVEREALQQEIANLLTDLQMRRSLTSNSPTAIIARHQQRKDNSRTIFEGDPEANRLDSMEKEIKGNGSKPPRP